jgi:hypothetical protein
MREPRHIIAILVALALAGCATQAFANSANVSCGQPTSGGQVTVTVTLDDKTTVTWTAAGILANDTPAQKAAKIRAAAPPSHAKLATDATSMTVGGGTVNVVSVTSVAPAKITGIAFTGDTTGEKEAPNVFVSIPLPQNHGLVSLSGTATGLDGGGGPSVVRVTALGATATVNPSAATSAADVEDAIMQQLKAGGVPVALADSFLIAKVYPGLEGDGRVIRIHAMDANGLETESTDTGLPMDVSGMIDVTAIGDHIPTVSEWGMFVVLLVMLSAGTIMFGFRKPAIAGAEGAAGAGVNRPTFVGAVFGPVLAITLAATVALLAGAMLVFGPLNPVDIGGAFVSAIVLAYLIQLWVLLKRS